MRKMSLLSISAFSAFAALLAAPLISVAAGPKSTSFDSVVAQREALASRRNENAFHANNLAAMRGLVALSSSIDPLGEQVARIVHIANGESIHTSGVKYITAANSYCSIYFQVVGETTHSHYYCVAADGQARYFEAPVGTPSFDPRNDIVP